MSNNEKQHRILVVEDDPTLLDNLVLTLTFEGYLTDTATNGLLAFERIQSQVPDLIISDIMMPVMTGYELLSQIRTDEFYADIPFILVSAKSSGMDIQYGIDMGANAYLPKPVPQADLLKTLSQLLD